MSPLPSITIENRCRRWLSDRNVWAEEKARARGFSKLFVKPRAEERTLLAHFEIVVDNFKTLPSRKTVTTRGSPGLRAATLL